MKICSSVLSLDTVVLHLPRFQGRKVTGCDLSVKAVAHPDITLSVLTRHCAFLVLDVMTKDRREDEQSVSALCTISGF